MIARASIGGMVSHDDALDDYIAALLDARACPERCRAAPLPAASEHGAPERLATGIPVTPRGCADASVYYLCAVSGVQLAIARQAVAQVGPMPPLTATQGVAPAWLLGSAMHGGRVCGAVDLACIIAPGGPAHTVPACAITLADSHWLLAVDAVASEQLLVTQNVRWRETAVSRPWLAGMASEPLCAVLNIAGLSELLSREWQRDPT
ncbi:MAG: hypothetical protein COZ47_09805 [Lysobacterales bacterium CG_4_10_14_3_um_filter_64_11]|nr:MAG: hypothetical protein COZ47_09805 [Xanthomonadales bacterium CG_4_10_14_3_um_filter_64_11]